MRASLLARHVVLVRRLERQVDRLALQLARIPSPTPRAPMPLLRRAWNAVARFAHRCCCFLFRV